MEITEKRKITVHDVCGRLTPPEKPTELMDIFGLASGYRIEEDRFNPGSSNTALKGEFYATDVATGEAFYSSKAYLPEPIHGAIIALIEKDPTKGVEFAATVSYKPAKTHSGYEYTVKQHIKPTQCEAMSHLKAAFPKRSKPA
jgi:hypothetical protein